jgi:hypothetical protein
MLREAWTVSFWGTMVISLSPSPSPSPIELTCDLEFFDADVVIATGQRTSDSATRREMEAIESANILPVVVGSGANLAEIVEQPGPLILGVLSGVEIGCEECLRVEFSGRIADQKPADRHRRHTVAIPDGSAGCDLDETIGSAIPQADMATLPRDIAILEAGGESYGACP